MKCLRRQASATYSVITTLAYWTRYVTPTYSDDRSGDGSRRLIKRLEKEAWKEARKGEEEIDVDGIRRVSFDYYMTDFYLVLDLVGLKSLKTLIGG